MAWLNIQAGCHGLINYTDIKAKCRYTLRQVFIRFFRLEIRQSCWYFRFSFVNCCPSNLLYGSTFPFPPLLFVNNFTVYTYTMCKGGIWGSGLQTPAAKSLYGSIFLRWWRERKFWNGGKLRRIFHQCRNLYHVFAQKPIKIVIVFSPFLMG